MAITSYSYTFVLVISFQAVSSLTINHFDRNKTCIGECNNEYMKCQQETRTLVSEKLICSNFKAICNQRCHHGKPIKVDKTFTVSHSGKDRTCIGKCKNEYMRCQQEASGSSEELICSNFKSICNQQCYL